MAEKHSETRIRRSVDRGHANHGWLKSHHTFSFAGFHDPLYMGYRSLRVINEDRVRGGMGFGAHSHRDFEIISYILAGELRHRDSMGHSAVMKPGDIQRITAGRGISHSEMNNSQDQEVHFLQIWLEAAIPGLEPNYAQQSFAGAATGRLTLACSPDGRNESLIINQQADIYIGKLSPDTNLKHTSRDSHHLWIQLISGDLRLGESDLHPGDGAAIDGEATITLDSATGAHFLLFDMD